MKSFISSKNYLPTILIVQDSSVNIGLDSSIFKLFNFTCLGESENITTLSWIQENQPALVLLAVNYSESPYLNLIPPLKLDWLTRDIPVVLMGSKSVLKCLTNLDFNAFLEMPYSAVDLRRIICSLINTPTYQIYA